MPYRFIHCLDDHDLEKYTYFFLEHRGQMSPPYDMTITMNAIQGHLTYGHVILGLNENDEVIGFISYYIGTPDQNYENASCALIEIVLVQQNYRQTRFFLRGFQFLLQHLSSLNPRVKEILFYAHTEFSYLTQLYSKFAHTASQYQGTMGLHDIYKATTDDLAALLLPHHTKKRRSYDL